MECHLAVLIITVNIGTGGSACFVFRVNLLQTFASACKLLFLYLIVYEYVARVTAHRWIRFAATTGLPKEGY